MSKNDVISIRIDSNIKRAIEQIGCINDLDTSTLLRQVIKDYLLDPNHHKEIQESIDAIAEKIKEEREEEFLRLKYKQRTKETRTIRTALYTFYYTKDINKAIQSIDDALMICRLDKNQKKTLRDFRKALETKDKETIAKHIQKTNSLRHVNIAELCRAVNEL